MFGLKCIYHLFFSELKQAKSKVDSIGNVNIEEIHILEEKTRRYERDLIKFQVFINCPKCVVKII